MLYSDYLKDKSHNAIKFGDAEGNPCVLKYSKGKKLKNYEIYGNSVQDGEPTPDNPVEIESVGDLVIDTSNEYYGKYDVPVTVLGKNLLNTYGFSTESMKTPSSPRKLNNSHGTSISTINPSDSITITQVYNSAYSLEKYQNGYFCIGINEEIKTGINYRISFDIDIISNPGNAEYIIILSNGGGSWKFNLREGRISGTFLYSKNSVYPTRRFIEFRCMGMSFTISNIMITHTENDNIEYEPYTSSTQHIYLDEPLRGVGEYSDYIDFRNKKVVRNIKNIILDGTENWFMESVNEKEYNNFYTATNPKAIARTEILSNKTTGSTSVSTRAENNGFISFSTKLNITYLIDTVDNWKTLLSTWYTEENPLIINYILATPIEEPIDNLPDIITNNREVCIIRTDTQVQPSNIKVKYIRV